MTNCDLVYFTCEVDVSLSSMHEISRNRRLPRAMQDVSEGLINNDSGFDDQFWPLPLVREDVQILISLLHCLWVDVKLPSSFYRHKTVSSTSEGRISTVLFIARRHCVRFTPGTTLKCFETSVCVWNATNLLSKMNTQEGSRLYFVQEEV